MTFKKTAAQGEITVRKIAKLPNGVSPLSKEGGKLIIGHSETGHHHVLEHEAEVFIADNAPAGMRVLYALIEQQNTLVHERTFDTHAPISLDPGAYEFRIGREYDPYAEIARRQAD
jgi:hypothetical protein